MFSIRIKNTWKMDCKVGNAFRPSPHIIFQSLSSLKIKCLPQEQIEDSQKSQASENVEEQVKQPPQTNFIHIHSNIHKNRSGETMQDSLLQPLTQNGPVPILTDPLQLPSVLSNHQTSLTFQYSPSLSNVRHQTNFYEGNRKSSCFKKKTLTFKQNETSKKVFFDNLNSQNQSKQQSFHNLSKNSRKSNNSKCSKTSISLEKNVQQIELNQVRQRKPSYGHITLHDLGDNHLIYRIKKLNKGQRQKGILKIQSNSQEQIRQFNIFHLIKNLKHQNIINLHQMNKELLPNNGILNLKIDFYPNNLKQYLQGIIQFDYSVQRVELQRKIILFKIIKGINFLHKNKIYHRNINPYNVLLNSKLQVVLSNFSSISTDNMPHQTSYKCDWLIRPPQIILQPNFKYCQAGDIWGLGCLIVFMLKHRMPFEEYSDANLIIQMIRTIGNITQEDLKSIGFKGSNKFIFPKMRTESMSKKFNCQQWALLDILSKIFVFNPFKRQTAVNLLKSTYFDSLRQRQFFKMYKNKYLISDLFEFSSIELSSPDKELVVPEWY